MSSLLTRPPRREAAAAPLPMRRAFFLGAGGLVVFLAALSLLFYTLPPRYDSFFFGLDPQGMHQFQGHFGLDWIRPLPFRYFSRIFRVFVVLLWASYALLVMACLRGGGLAARPLILLIGAVAAAVAIFSAPLLSTDAYAYLSHGQIFVLHGQNPYLFGPKALVQANDPVAHYLVWDVPTVYGPVWTWIEIGIAALLRQESLWTQVLAMKLVEAGALVAAAIAGRSLTARWMPGWENVTLAAIGLNPLLLLEGPGNGHNDLICLAFLLIGAALFFDGKYVAAALCLGLSVGIKPITLGLLPWALLEYGRGRSWRQALPALVLAPVLVLLPLTLFFAPLWAGPATLAAMQVRTSYGQTPAFLAQAAAVHGWLAAHGAGPGLASLLTSVVQDRWLVALYAGLSIWLWKAPRTGGWLSAWAVFSFGMMFLFLKPPFPWYILWFWPVCLLRWDRLHLSLSAACLVLSLIWTFGYGDLSDIGNRPVQYWIKLTPTLHGDPVSYSSKI